MKKHLIAILLTSVSLSACLHTPYETPAVNTPSAFQHAASSGGYTASERWWENFGDPKLNAVIDKVLVSNNDLAAAAIRLRQARLRTDVYRLDQLPQASGSVDASKQLNDTAPGDNGESYSARVGVSYEADLWGRLASQTDAARWEAEATGEDLEATRLSLIGTAATFYWQIAYTHDRIRNAQASLDYAQRVRAMITVQHDAGSVSGIEVSEADQTVNAQIAALSELQQQQVEYRAALALLMNGDAVAPEQEATALPTADLPAIAPGLPAELLGRRPDLKAAEYRLRSTLSGVDATRASYYPALSLTGSAGGSSTALSDVVKNPIGTLGAGLTLPFLNFAQNRLNIKVAKADYEVAVIDFRQTLLEAFSDVDNTLSAQTQLAIQGARLEQSLAAAQKTEALYALRYRTGAVSLRIWLDAQESLRSAQQAVDANRLNRLITQATLYQALGGGA
jgi:NodT family efflux transporter outer membrane factor (OMF) lipoprotein